MGSTMPDASHNHFLRTQYELAKFCAQRLHAHNVTAMSAALSFRTIFALVPLLVLAFLVARSVGVVDDGKEALRNFLDTSGISRIAAPQDPNDPALFLFEGPVDPSQPTAKAETFNVADKIQTIVEDVEKKLTYERVGPVGAILFIWTALTLLTTIEASLNRIFEAPKSRAMGRRIMIFWCAVTLGPILIIAASYLGRAAIEICHDLPGLSIFANFIGWLAPNVTGILVVAAGYRFIPNTQVRISAAIGGAIVAVPIWMLARWAFVFYVERYVSKGNLYGVIGLLPLFLLWVNISWTIFLFGAEFAHTATSLAHLRRRQNAEDMVLGPSDWLAVAVSVAQSFTTGKGPLTLDQIAESTDLPPDRIEKIIRKLTDAKILNTSTTENQQPKHTLAKPPHLITTQQIIDLADPNAAPADNHSPIRQSITEANADTRESQESQTLADLINALPRETTPSPSTPPADAPQPTPATT